MNALLEGLLFGFTLTVLAGPIFFALVQVGIEHGFRAGMMVAFGVFSSDFLFVTAVYFGLATIQSVVQLEGFNLTLGFIGGIALIVIGLITYFTRPKFLLQKEILDHPIIEDLENIKRYRSLGFYFKLWSKGFFINTFNPFTFFFWGVVAAGKLAESGFSQNEFFLFFGGILSMIMISDTLKVYLAKVISRYLKPRYILLVRTISGVAFVIFGIVLMVRVMM